MKKLLIFMLVLGMASLANATYIIIDNYSVDGTIDIGTDGSGGPWESYFALVVPTVDATITGGALPTAQPLDASSVIGDASTYITPPSGQDGRFGFIGSYSLSPPFTGVTNVTILEDFGFAFESGKTQAIVTLYEVDEGTGALTFESCILIPEPMTVLLLSLGGLFLRRRK